MVPIRSVWSGCTVVLLVLVQLGSAQSGQQTQLRQSVGHVIVPESSMARDEDNGVRARTHLQYVLPAGGPPSRTGTKVREFPPVPGYFFETPASIACVYRLVANPNPGCNPNETTENPSGGGGAIALVDAYDDPNAAGDLSFFSQQFGLPSADLTVVFANGTQPPVDPSGGWELEESLDVQWAHAMAPHAKLYLVEAPSNSFADLFSAAQVAAHLVAEAGGGEVSMSFGGNEFILETGFDSSFTTQGVVYLASAGDTPGASYPSTSPRVISAGGTTISRNSLTGDFLSETSWQNAGGGPSQVEDRPDFQDRVARQLGPTRGTPDLSFDANPNTGVWVFDSNQQRGPSWYVVGGTSVSAPALAGIINAAGKFRRSSVAENRALYEHIRDSRSLRDIVYGNCGLNGGSYARSGWDPCSGAGSPIGLGGK